LKVLIFDPIGGASGDMILSSLVHLGCPVDYLRGVFDALGIGNFEVRTKKKKISGLDALNLHFDLGCVKREHDHAEIRKMIEKAAIPEKVKEKSLKIFTALANAEAALHGEHCNHVRFHEAGALDSILDILGIAAALDWLDVERIYGRPLPMGKGLVKCRHGIIPVPSPATTLLTQGLKVRWPEVEGELTTPTAAAVFKAIVRNGEPPGNTVVVGSGYGCGDKTFENWPNLFRSILCETAEEHRDRVFVVECDVDDMIPEDWEGAIQKLFETGALDVTLTAQVMKRGRPCIGVRVIAREEHLQEIEKTILVHTTTIGIRCYPVERITLPRRNYQIATPYGKLWVKEVVTPEGKKRRKPEFKDLQGIAVRNNLSLPALRKEIDNILKELEKEKA
jgi:hypothetical protein